MLESKKIAYIPIQAAILVANVPSLSNLLRLGGRGGEGRRQGTVVEEARKIEGGAPPLVHLKPRWPPVTVSARSR